LGLSIVQNLVQLHKGDVTAQSSGEGQGAVFTVRIPLMEAAQDQCLPPLLGTPEAPVWGEASPLAGALVLIVDDDPDVRELLGRILEECGAGVHRSEDAFSALEALKQHKPDVVISDIGMPGMDGFELLRRIRQLPPEAGGTTPAIALTAFARPEDRLRALQVGYNAHLSKPIEPASILQALGQLLERAHRNPRQT
jgi:CheY-like chemotaxis protein